MNKRYPQSILVTCEIPWDKNSELMEDLFRQELRATMEHFPNLYIFGTAGEGYAVTLSQFERITRIFHEETNKDGIYPMIAAIGMSTAQVVEKVGIAYDIGIRDFQIPLTPWGPLNDHECITYFKDVCGNFPDAKFLHYQQPIATKRMLLGPDYQRIEAAVPNFVGTKNCISDLYEIISIATHTTELQHFWGELAFPHGCLYDECSMLSSYGSLFPTKTKEFFNYGITGQIDKVFQMQRDYWKVVETFEEPSQGLDLIFGAMDKMTMKASGVDVPLRLLSPYQEIDMDIYEKCINALRTKYPEWLK